MSQALVTQQQVELKVGSLTLSQLTDDDGDGVADQLVLDYCSEVASDVAYGILLKAYPSEQRVQQLVSDDAAVRDAVVDVYVGVAGERRPSLLTQDGETPYSAWRKRGERFLQDVVAGKYRPKGEALGGENELQQTDVQRKPGNAVPFRTVIAGTRDDPTPGGF